MLIFKKNVWALHTPIIFFLVDGTVIHRIFVWHFINLLENSSRKILNYFSRLLFISHSENFGDDNMYYQDFRFYIFLFPSKLILFLFLHYFFFLFRLIHFIYDVTDSTLVLLFNILRDVLENEWQWFVIIYSIYYDIIVFRIALE